MTFGKEMKTVSRRIRTAAVIILSLVVILAIGFFSLIRPLLPSDDYALTATVGSSLVEAKLFQPFPFG